MSALTKDYEGILAGLNPEAFDLTRDKYSGVFLPVPFEEYWESSPKVMLVGRETAGWNNKTGKKIKNTIRHVIDANNAGTTGEIIEEAVKRYRNHLKHREDGSLVRKSGSRFKQYYFRLARELKVSPKALIYSNLFAWDYNKKSPKERPAMEFSEVASISNHLLAAQIKHLKPDFIIFAAGYNGIDPVIRSLFNDHFGGYENTAPIVPKKLWEFRAGGSTCFRIAHPRATHGHGEFRKEVITRIKSHLGLS